MKNDLKNLGNQKSKEYSEMQFGFLLDFYSRRNCHLPIKESFKPAHHGGQISPPFTRNIKNMQSYPDTHICDPECGLNEVCKEVDKRMKIS